MDTSLGRMIISQGYACVINIYTIDQDSQFLYRSLFRKVAF